MSKADAAVTRVLTTPHAKLLLQQSSNDSQRRLRDLTEEIRRRSVGRGRRLASVAFKAALVLTLFQLSTTLLFGQYPVVWNLLQNTEIFSRVELGYNQLMRRMTVSLGIHKYELLQAREREQCLVPNPMYRQPLRCCPCNRHKVVTASSAEPIRTGYERLFDRMVGPFAYGNNSQPGITFPELRSIVTDNLVAMNTGSNRLSVLWPQGSDAPTTPSLEDLFLGDLTTAPPAGQAVAWLLGHLPAIRVLRQFIRRPDHIPELAEDILARQFVFLGDGLPAREPIHLGDLSIVRGLVYVYALHGKVSISLALKSECCPVEVAKQGYRNQTKRLGPGDVLGLMSDCYWVSVAKRETSGYAIVYFGSVYNGINPIESKAAKRPSA